MTDQGDKLRSDHGHEDHGHVHISVNDVTFTVHTDRISGLEIKQAAIQAGAPIQPDFVLSEVLPNGEQPIIPDEKMVHLKDGDKFWAIPGDDNS